MRQANRTEQRVPGKKFLIFIIVLLVLVSLFFIQCFKGNENADYSEKKIRKNISTIATFDVTKRLSKDQYRRIFSTSAILGDSITEGLADYGWLGSEQVFCRIGASIISGDELFTSAAKTYPGFAFCSFGMNDMGNYSGNADAFIEKYTSLIKEFKKISPNTVILVNGITPPAKSAIASNEILGNYKKFNNALKQMCKDLKLTYIDNTYIIEEHPEYYAGDGIHVTADYYPLWMNNMILKAGI